MNDNRSSEIKKRVFRDEVAEYIVNEIVQSRLGPGDRIVETRVSKELQVSQGAVREAIRDLIAKGLLYSEAYKGTYVRRFSRDDLYDYYRVRSILEKTAVKWAVERNATKHADELLGIVESMEESAGNGGATGLSRLDLLFHTVLVESAENRSLFDAWDALGNLFWLAVGAGRVLDDSSRQEFVTMHKEMAECFARKDCERIHSLLDHHFNRAIEVVKLTN